MSRALHDPGAMNHRMLLERLVESADGDGTLDDGYAAVDFVWAALMPQRHDETLLAQQIDERARHIVTIRYRTDIATGWRFVLRDREFEVVAIVDPDERRRYLQCHTVEVGR